MKANRYITGLLLTAILLLFSSSAFSQIESRDSIKSGTLLFSPGSYVLSPASKSALAVLASQMSYNPSFKVVVTGTTGGSKPLQQLSWDRVNTVIEHMSEQYNIDRNRFIFQYDGIGPENTVSYAPAQEGQEGSGYVKPPYPELRR
jgi:outer membrane protein OmpA-like peptidoglycan-associated protein